MTDAVDTEPQVKSLTFATLRTFAPKYLGPEQYDTVRSRIGAQTRALLDTAEPGIWIAEAAMRDVLTAIHQGPLAGDDEGFIRFARALAHEGITRFMRIFLTLASARFVLKRVPVVWNRLRRNAGEVVVEVDGDHVAVLYAGFPFFGTATYRLLSLANCQALVHAATRRFPAGTIADWSEDTLRLEFDLAARPEA